MPSDNDALYPPRLRAWCEAMRAMWNGVGTQDSVELARTALCGMEELAAEWIVHRSLGIGPARSMVSYYDRYVELLTPRTGNPRD